MRYNNNDRGLKAIPQHFDEAGAWLIRVVDFEITIETTQV
jgi:hypothetical protein